MLRGMFVTVMSIATLESRVATEIERFPAKHEAKLHQYINAEGIKLLNNSSTRRLNHLSWCSVVCDSVLNREPRLQIPSGELYMFVRDSRQIDL